MWFSPIFERFVEKSPVTVILRTLMEVVLSESRLARSLAQNTELGLSRSVLWINACRRRGETVAVEGFPGISKLLNPLGGRSSKLDELFEKTAQTGYTRELLFSTLVKMMTQVVCSVRSEYWSGL